MSKTVQGYIVAGIFALIVVVFLVTGINHYYKWYNDTKVYEVVLENGEIAKWSLPGHHVSGDKVHLRRDHRKLKATIR